MWRLINLLCNTTLIKHSLISEKTTKQKSKYVSLNFGKILASHVFKDTKFFIESWVTQKSLLYIFYNIYIIF